MKSIWSVALVALAATAALAPLPASFIEEAYSNGVYPPLQSILTWVSNLVPVALLDVMLVAGVAWWAWRLVKDVANRAGVASEGHDGGFGWMDILMRAAARTVAGAAAAYVLFLMVWGLNYRRVPLADKLQFEAAAVSSEAANTLARRAVADLNALYRDAHLEAEAMPDAIDSVIAEALARVERSLKVARPARPARPKRTILDRYLDAAGVDGVTDPYFLETIVASDLLPFERPFVIAHEWSHLAGFADEGEANFVGWLACMHGDERLRYSGWLFLYNQTLSTVRPHDRAEIEARLGPGPRSDLGAIAERARKRINPTVSAAGWRAYDGYLKVNRVEAGAASYGEFVKLVLGTRFENDWTPKLRH